MFLIFKSNFFLRSKPCAASTEGRLDDGADFGGPSLFIAGNDLFTESDFRGLQTFGRSGKKDKFDKDGRFGIGMVTNFAIADVVELISGDSYAVLDPSRIGAGKTKKKPGARYTKEQLQTYFPKQLESFERMLNTLKEKQLKDIHSSAKSIFRLPLRKKKSEFGERIDMAKVRADLIDIANRPLAFLFDRHVRSINFLRIKRDGSIEKIAFWNKTFKPVSAPLKFLDVGLREFEEADFDVEPSDFYKSLPKTRDDVGKRIVSRDPLDTNSKFCMSEMELRNNAILVQDSGSSSSSSKNDLSGNAAKKQKNSATTSTATKLPSGMVKDIQLAKSNHQTPTSFKFIFAAYCDLNKTALSRCMKLLRESDYALLCLAGTAIPLSIDLHNGKTVFMGEKDFANYMNSDSASSRFFCFRELSLEGHNDRAADVFVNGAWHLKSSRTGFQYKSQSKSLAVDFDESKSWNQELIETVVTPTWAAGFMHALQYFQEKQTNEFRSYQDSLIETETNLRSSNDPRILQKLDDFKQKYLPQSACLRAYEHLVPKMYDSGKGPIWWEALARSCRKYLMKNKVPCVPVSKDTLSSDIRGMESAMFLVDDAFLSQAAVLSKIEEALSDPISYTPSDQFYWDPKNKYHAFDRESLNELFSGPNNKSKLETVHPMTREKIYRNDFIPHVVLSKCGRLFIENSLSSCGPREKNVIYKQLKEIFKDSRHDPKEMQHNVIQDIQKAIQFLDENSNAQSLPEITLQNAYNELAVDGEMIWRPMSEVVFDFNIAEKFSESSEQLIRYYGMYRPLVRKFMPICFLPVDMQRTLTRLSNDIVVKLDLKEFCDRIGKYCGGSDFAEKLKTEDKGMPIEDVPDSMSFFSDPSNCVGLMDFLLCEEWGMREEKKELEKIFANSIIPMLLYTNKHITACGHIKKCRSFRAKLAPSNPTWFVSDRMDMNQVQMYLPKVVDIPLKFIPIKKVLTKEELEKIRSEGFVEKTDVLSNWCRHADDDRVLPIDMRDLIASELPLIQVVGGGNGRLVSYKNAKDVVVLKTDRFPNLNYDLFTNLKYELAECLLTIGKFVFYEPSPIRRLVYDNPTFVEEPTEIVSLLQETLVCQYISSWAADKKNNLMRLFDGTRVREVLQLPIVEHIDGEYRCFGGEYLVEMDKDESGRKLLKEEDSNGRRFIDGLFAGVRVAKFKSVMKDMAKIFKKRHFLCAPVFEHLTSSDGLVKLSIPDRQRWLRYFIERASLNNLKSEGETRIDEDARYDFFKKLGDIAFFDGDKRISDFYDSRNGLAREVLSEDKFLPQEFNTNAAHNFLKEIGLRDTISTDVILETAQKIEKEFADATNFADRETAVQNAKKKSTLLLKEVMRSEVREYDDPVFSNKLQCIAFIPGRKKSLTNSQDRQGAPREADEEEGLFKSPELVFDEKCWNCVFSLHPCLTYETATMLPPKTAIKKFRFVDTSQTQYFLETTAKHLKSIIETGPKNEPSKMNYLLTQPLRHLMLRVKLNLGANFGANRDPQERRDKVLRELEELKIKEILSKEKWIPGKKLDGSRGMFSAANTFTDVKFLTTGNTPKMIKSAVAETLSTELHDSVIAQALGITALDRVEAFRLIGKLFPKDSGNSRKRSKILNDDEIEAYMFLFRNYIQDSSRMGIVSDELIDPVEKLLLTSDNKLISIANDARFAQDSVLLDRDLIKYCENIGIADRSEISSKENVVILHEKVETVLRSVPEKDDFWRKVFNIRKPENRFIRKLDKNLKATEDEAKGVVLKFKELIRKPQANSRKTSSPPFVDSLVLKTFGSNISSSSSKAALDESSLMRTKTRNALEHIKLNIISENFLVCLYDREDKNPSEYFYMFNPFCFPVDSRSKDNREFRIEGAISSKENENESKSRDRSPITPRDGPRDKTKDARENRNDRRDNNRDYNRFGTSSNAIPLGGGGTASGFGGLNNRDNKSRERSRDRNDRSSKKESTFAAKLFEDSTKNLTLYLKSDVQDKDVSQFRKTVTSTINDLIVPQFPNRVKTLPSIITRILEEFCDSNSVSNDLLRNANEDEKDTNARYKPQDQDDSASIISLSDSESEINLGKNSKPLKPEDYLSLAKKRCLDFTLEFKREDYPNACFWLGEAVDLVVKYKIRVVGSKKDDKDKEADSNYKKFKKNRSVLKIIKDEKLFIPDRVTELI